jgi:hypothetical protein
MDVCNKVLRQLNEVELQQSNFTTAGGFHASVKDAVNYAINDINQAEYQWPFNYKSGSQVLTPGTQKYDLPSDYKVMDWYTFYLKSDTNLNILGRPLKLYDYNFWHENMRADDATREDQPEGVVYTNADSFIITPTPDEAYTVEFEYWGTTDELVNHDDVPQVPARYRKALVEGALMWAYRFRDNYEQAETMEDQFYKTISEMRTLLINKYDSAYTGYVGDKRRNRGAFF